MSRRIVIATNFYAGVDKLQCVSPHSRVSLIESSRENRVAAGTGSRRSVSCDLDYLKAGYRRSGCIDIAQILVNYYALSLIKQRCGSVSLDWHRREENFIFAK